jgi:hypothetical protein
MTDEDDARLKAVGRLLVARKRGDIPCPPFWTAERDIKILESGGVYAALSGLAVRWRVPMQNLVARWHRVRVV